MSFFGYKFFKIINKLVKYLPSIIITTSVIFLLMFFIFPQTILAPPPAPVWPTVWTTPTCNYDPSDESPSWLDIISVDIIGDGYNPAVYYVTDANYLYLRERVEGNPSGTGGFRQVSWVVVDEQTGDNYYDFLFTLDGNDEKVQIWKNTVQSQQINWNPIFNDPAEIAIWNGSTGIYARIDSDGTGHYFVSWAVPKSYGEFTLGANAKLYFSTSADANNYNKDHLNCYEAVCGNGIKEGTEQCDPGTNNPSDCCSSNCMFKSNTYTCRASAGVCDAAEQCSGISATCPSDVKSTDLCRSATGVCDVEEYCDGINNDCPADVFRPDTYECRVANGLCDIAEFCTGSGPACPTNQVQPNTYECRASAGECDIAENCDGLNKVCPTDVYKSSSFECRPAVDACDKTEYCTGLDPLCPVNSYQPQGIDCGICAACDGNGYCNYDSSQNGDCGFCEKCTALFTCGYQTEGEDIKEECSVDACKYGYCNGFGLCAMEPDTTDCGICSLCDGSGNCNVFDETQDEDCPVCKECSSLGTCYNVPDGTDPKYDCGEGCQRCLSGICQDYDVACSPPYPLWSDYLGICGWQRADPQCANDACDDTPDYQKYCNPYIAFNDNTDCWTTGLEHCSQTCGAECDQNGDCNPNSCSVTYDDYCTGKKLTEYDNDKMMDSTIMTDSCDNTCQNDCTCTHCSVDCSPPSTNTYCVKDVCGAECDQTSVKRCLPENAVIYYCIGTTSYQTPDFDTCKDTCVWDNCQTKIITEKDPRCKPLSPPTCTWCTPIRPPLTTTIPSFTFPKPTFTFPTFDFSSLFRR